MSNEWLMDNISATIPGLRLRQRVAERVCAGQGNESVVLQAYTREKRSGVITRLPLAFMVAEEGRLWTQGPQGLQC